KAKVDSILGANQADQLLAIAIINNDVAPVVSKSEEDIFDKTIDEVTQKYPDVKLANVAASFKTNYYARKKNWPAFRDAVQAYIQLDSSKVSPGQLNSFAWAIFENCDDPACVEAAISWSKKSLEGNQEPAL